MSKIIVIGAGASGIVTSIILKRKGLDVTILEKQSSACKKILVTGNGRCNFFNENMCLDNYYSNNMDILEKFINEENISKVYEFFDSIGMIYKSRNGYLYPYSNSAISVKTILMNEVEALNIPIIYDTKVESITKEDKFIINTNNVVYTCDKVVYACGTNAGSKETDFINYDILGNLGHKIIKPAPALVGLLLNGSYLKDWNGIRCDAKITLLENDKVVAEETGEAQLTDYGISGICVMNISRLVARSRNKMNLKINFLPFLDAKDVGEFIKDRIKKLNDKTVSELLETLFNYKLINILVRNAKLDRNKKVNKLDNDEIKKLINILINFTCDVVGTNDISKGQVVCGGLSLEEINEHFESKRIKDLYVCGEVLDVDGKCGGYNLGFAWISGLCIGEYIND